MTALVLDKFKALSTLGHSLRALSARLGQALDGLVAARAARSIPEWQMEAVQSEIKRYLDQARPAKRRHSSRPASR